MMSVTNADANTRNSVRVLRPRRNGQRRSVTALEQTTTSTASRHTHIMNGVGCPFSIDPVLTAR